MYKLIVIKIGANIFVGDNKAKLCLKIIFIE